MLKISVTLIKSTAATPLETLAGIVRAVESLPERPHKSRGTRRSDPKPAVEPVKLPPACPECGGRSYACTSCGTVVAEPSSPRTEIFGAVPPTPPCGYKSTEIFGAGGEPPAEPDWLADAFLSAAASSGDAPGDAGPKADPAELSCLGCKARPIPPDRTYYCSAVCQAADASIARAVAGGTHGQPAFGAREGP